MTATAPTILALLRATAEEVAAGRADLELAGSDLRAARAEFLEALLESVRPAARALANPVALAMTVSPAGTTTDPAPWRGLYLAGLGPTITDREPVPCDGLPRAVWPERGRHAGTRLLLRDDGSLVELAYDGPWSNVPGEVSSWKATVTALAPAEALVRYKLADIMEAIGTAMTAAADGKAPARAAELRGKGGRIRSLAPIVRGL